jgi:palmitoyl-protein thioesterase
VNNDDPTSFNPDFRMNLTQVKNFGMFMWENDSIIIPRESAWFANWDSYHRLKYLRDSIGYQEDYVGMQTLDKAGKLWFYKNAG